jgi:uncharacterized membrane protein YdjX (TVP38/TMEM64 family)
MVSGPCAVALGELARQRWHDATGEELTPPDENKSLWLEDIEPEFHDADIAISLTQPDDGKKQVRQVEQLYLHMIESAQRYIYIENQYLTADKIGDALAHSLDQQKGPEIIIVGPYNTNGWLSQFTMDVMRSRMLRRLHEADTHGRLRTYYPHLPDADEETAINVHAKVMVVDDTLLRIGSSNLNNRSMGLDSECDLTIKASDDKAQTAVQAFRNRLLAEHLDVPESDIAAHYEKHSSLIKTIESLQNKKRSLRRLDPQVSEEMEQNLPHKALIDPETPVDSQRLRDILVPKKVRRPTARRIMLGFLALGIILAMTAIWRWSPLSELIDAQTLAEQIRNIQGSVLTPLAAMAIVTLGSLAGIPITLLLLAAMLVFGGLQGGIYGICGALLSAVVAYIVGQNLGRDTLRRLAGPRLNHISKELARKGVLTVIAVRLIPIAPFVVVNLVAGVSHIRLRDFIIGSFIGLLPGTLALALITEGVIRAAQQPNAYHLSLVALVLVLLAAGGMFLRNWILKQKQQKS